MDVLEAIKAHRSVKKYKPTPVPDRELQKILGAARLAPSVDNLQPWKFIVVNDEEIKHAVARAANSQFWIAEAPIVVVACGLLDEAQGMIGGYMNSYPVDVAIAMSYLTLSAQEMGLATCWVSMFDEDKLKSVLKISQDAHVVALTPLGFPDEEPSPNGRKHLSEIVSYNKF